MPRTIKNPSRKKRRIVQKGGDIFDPYPTPAEIRNGLWIVRDNWDKLSATLSAIKNGPNYSKLVDSSRMNSDWGLPSYQAFRDQYGLFFNNYNTVTSIALSIGQTLPEQLDPLNILKNQMTDLDNDVAKQVDTLRGMTINVASVYDYNKTFWTRPDSAMASYKAWYDVSVTVIPDQMYTPWKSSGSTSYPTDKPTDNDINNSSIDITGSGGKAALKYVANPTLINSYTALVTFIYTAPDAYQRFLNYINNSAINPAFAAIDANILKAKALVEQSKPYVVQAQMAVYIKTKVIMGLVIYPEYSKTIPVIFITAPNNICVYIDTTTWKLYNTTFEAVKNSQALKDALTGCLDFNKTYTTAGTIAATIAALPNNSLVKALAFKDAIATKMANLQVGDIAAPPPPPPPTFTGYGKWVDSAAQAAASSGNGTIIVVDSSGKNVLLNGDVWTIGRVWTIIINGSPESYFFSNNVKYDVTIIS